MVSFSQAVQTVNSISNQVKNRNLSDAEMVALQAAWEKISYTQAIEATNSSYNEIYVRSDAGRKLWQMLSDHFGTKITKSNFRDYIAETFTPSSKQTISSEILGGHPPSTKAFIGRKHDIKKLKQNSKTSQCICITGISGIGKSALAAKVIDQFAKQSKLFHQFLWLSVYYQPSLSNLLKKLIGHLGIDRNIESIPRQDLTDVIIEFFQQNQALIVLDEADSIIGLESNPDLREEYQIFFRRIIEEQHKSCIWLTAKNVVDELETYQSMGLPVEILNLGRLSQEDAKQLIEAKGIPFDAEWEKMIHSCMGNPLLIQNILKKVAQVEDGKVGLIREKTSLALNEFEFVLKKIFNKAIDDQGIETLVLCRIAILQSDQGIPLLSLADEILDINPEISRIDVLNCVERLNKHNLISLKPEGGGLSIIMGSMIKKYILRNYADCIENTLTKAI